MQSPSVTIAVTAREVPKYPRVILDVMNLRLPFTLPLLYTLPRPYRPPDGKLDRALVLDADIAHTGERGGGAASAVESSESSGRRTMDTSRLPPQC